MEIIGEVELPIEVFKDALGLNIGSASWYKEICPSLPDEWCELFELHTSGLDRQILNKVTDELKQSEEQKFDKVIKYFDGEIPEVLDNIDLDLFPTTSIDELSAFGECPSLFRFKECECVLEFNKEE